MFAGVDVNNNNWDVRGRPDASAERKNSPVRTIATPHYVTITDIAISYKAYQRRSINKHAL